MFKKAIITDAQLVRQWRDSYSLGQQIKVDEYEFILEKQTDGVLINCTHPNVMIGSLMAFLQATLKNGSNAIIIESKPFIKLVFTLVFGGIISMSLLIVMKENLIGAIVMLILASLIFYYNYVQINKGILIFKEVMEKVNIESN